MTRRPALLACLVLLAVAALPHLRAVALPPRGHEFVGTFLSREDFYNYLGYVQQAEAGRWLLANKLDGPGAWPVMFNLEWWTAGRLSAVLGGQPLLAFWILGFAGTVALVLGLDRWLRLAGLGSELRWRALLLVLFGGGLGGLRYLAFGPPAWRSLDLIAGLYPFIEVVANPHFVMATALLVWALLALMREDWRGQAVGVLLGSALGLSRPYDLALLVAVRGLAVALGEPPRAWVRRLAPLAGLLPVVAYLYWLFYRSGAYSTFFAGYIPFVPLDFAVAFGPGVLLVLAFWRPPRRAAATFAPQAHLAAWVLLGVVLATLRPVGYYFQMLVGIGLPLLALAAIGLARKGPSVLAVAAAAMSTTTLVALHVFLRDEPRWFVPAERMAVARALGATCRPGDVVLCPADIGLFSLAFSSCTAYVSERLRPPEREEELGQFYGIADPAWRSSLLERNRITHVVLPGDPGATPSAWLGAQTPFRRVAAAGSPPRTLTVYSTAPTPRAPTR
jgi:hypothetical protein